MTSNWEETTSKRPLEIISSLLKVLFTLNRTNTGTTVVGTRTDCISLIVYLQTIDLGTYKTDNLYLKESLSNTLTQN